MKRIFILIITALQFGLVKSQQVKFIWPVKPVTAYSEVPDFYSVNNYVDQDATANRKDWACNTGSAAYTYDGHQGLDIDLWPFFWSMMDNNYISVVAAADGRVVAVSMNNNNENNCPGNLAGNWNYIAIRHDDNSTSIYGHLRNNSALVTTGQTVVQGQPIAFVGSSGNSSNPHLHFEVNSGAVTNGVNTGLPPIANGVIEPYYTNSCNALTTSSWWQSQKPYKEPAVVRVMTHYGVPSVLDGTNSNFCRSSEDKKAKNNFNPGEQVYIGMAFRDIEQSIAISCVIFKPDGTISFAIPFVSPAAYKKWYNTISYTLPADAQAGTYKIVVSFQTHSATHFFSVGCKATENPSGTVDSYSAFIAGSLIAATSEVVAGGRLRLQSGGQVRLKPGFKAREGSILKARIKDCNYSE